MTGLKLLKAFSLVAALLKKLTKQSYTENIYEIQQTCFVMSQE